LSGKPIGIVRYSLRFI